MCGGNFSLAIQERLSEPVWYEVSTLRVLASYTQPVLSIIMGGVLAWNEPWPPFISNPYTWIYGNRSPIPAFKKSQSSLSTEWFTPHLHLARRCNKGKAVPLQAWSGPEGSRKLRFPDYMTTAQDCGKVFSLMHRPPLPPGNAPGTHFC
jgi:hypothetical protein